MLAAILFLLANLPTLVVSAKPWENRNGWQVGFDLLYDIFLQNNPQHIEQDIINLTESPRSTSFAPLRVFGAGLPRTGTGSLTLALRRLGYKPTWGDEIFKFTDVLDAVNSDSDEFANTTKSSVIEEAQRLGFDAVGLDILGWYLFDEVARTDDFGMEKYKNTKVIYTSRDPKKWAQSVGSTILHHFRYFQSAPFSFLRDFKKLQKNFEGMENFLMDGDVSPLANSDGSEHASQKILEQLEKAYYRHDRRVKEAFEKSGHVRSGNFLNLTVGAHGWEELCAFLDIDAAECPSTIGEQYPRANDRAAMVAITWVFWSVGWVWPVIPLVLVAAALGSGRLIMIVYREVFRRKKKKEC